MIGLESLTPEFATDLIDLVNSLQKLPKTSKVAYSVQNKKTGSWSKKQFSYVPLDNILERIKKNKNFSFMQPIGFDEKSQKYGVKCVLIHKSGKYLVSDSFEIKTTPGMKIQDEGAEITYRKRYAAGAFFGIATEEDTNGNDPDAESVEEKKETLATPKQIEWLKKLYTKEEIKNALDGLGYKSPKELTIKEASDLISVKKEESK